MEISVGSQVDGWRCLCVRCQRDGASSRDPVRYYLRRSSFAALPATDTAPEIKGSSSECS